MKFLTVGRHFRLSPSAKLVVGRDEEENEALEAMANKADTLLKLKDHQGPLALLRGACDDNTISMAASIAAYHTKVRSEPSLRVDLCNGDLSGEKTISVKTAGFDDIEKVRL